MTTYLNPNRFYHKYHIKPATMRSYANQGMPSRKERNGHISYPEKECLEWIEKRRTQGKPEAEFTAEKGIETYFLTSSWLKDILRIDRTTLHRWVDSYNAPAAIQPNGRYLFPPMKFLNWFRVFAKITLPGASIDRRAEQLANLEREIPRFVAEHPGSEESDLQFMTSPIINEAVDNLCTKIDLQQNLLQPTETAFHADPLVQNALNNLDTQITETTNTMKNTKNNTTTPATTELKPQHKTYDPCRTYQERDQIQVTLCNGRLNGIPQHLLYLTGTVLKNENSVGIVLCSISGNPEQIPASNLRLLRAAEDIPTYAILHTGYTYYVTPKTEQEAIAFISYTPSPDSPITRKQAEELAELILQTANENTNQN